MNKQKKTVGVITFWESDDNYGQQLQCWALQQHLRSHDFNPFLIRARMFTSENYKSDFRRLLTLCKKIFAFILIRFGALRCKFLSDILISKYGQDWACRQFEIFRWFHIKQTPIYNSYSDIVLAPPEADIYIAGSDQIWNADLSDDIWNLTFLQFGDKNIKRIAYAPSMAILGLDKIKESHLKELLSSFNYVSARESRTVKFLNTLGTNCKLVLDPTLLVSSDSYLSLIAHSNRTKYIYIYSINYTNENEIPINEIRRYAKDNSLDIIVTPSSGYISSRELFDDVIYDYSTIPQWLYNIKNANLVVSASFHGIAIAIRMHQNFIYTPLLGKLSSGNDRVLDLLNHLGLENQIWNFGRKIESYISSIDWDSVEQHLSEFRKISNDYLFSALSK